MIIQSRCSSGRNRLVYLRKGRNFRCAERNEGMRIRRQINRLAAFQSGNQNPAQFRPRSLLPAVSLFISKVDPELQYDLFRPLWESRSPQRSSLSDVANLSDEGRQYNWLKRWPRPLRRPLLWPDAVVPVLSAAFPAGAFADSPSAPGRGAARSALLRDGASVVYIFR